MSENLFLGGVEHRKLKRKIEEISSNDVVDLELSLSLKHANNKVVVDESSSKLLSGLIPKFLKRTNNQLIVSTQSQFSCKLCNMKFSNYQALGGHQTTHRRERAISRIDKKFHARNFGFGAHLFPCSTMAHHHHSSSHGQMHPMMTHMSTMPWSNFVPNYGNTHGLNNTSIGGQRFEMSNPWGMASHTPQNVCHKDLGLGFKHNEVASFNVANRTTMASFSLSDILGNQGVEHKQSSPSRPNLSLKL
ncbi:hypothetical protein VNO78_33194 [Psophocarpus tetragonolobus]|uniref:C2H2-type domain-containing protein n=1 Tax=Psophocarpus tetragonolobus TaxID=3891 RepID=A0AAN9P1X6_PSOTE